MFVQEMLSLIRVSILFASLNQAPSCERDLISTPV